MESDHLYEVSLVHTLTHFDAQIALGGIRHGRGRLDRGIGEQAADKLFGIGTYEPLPLCRERVAVLIPQRPTQIWCHRLPTLRANPWISAYNVRDTALLA